MGSSPWPRVQQDVSFYLYLGRTCDPKVEDKIQEIVDTNSELYKRITDDPAFGQALRNFLFDDQIQDHRLAEELLSLDYSKTLEFKSLRRDLKENRRDDKRITHAVLKTVGAFLNTEDGYFPNRVADDRTILGVRHDRLENEDTFMWHLAQAVRNGCGDMASTCIDPDMQTMEGKTMCLLSCQRSPEPVFLKWRGTETGCGFFVRSGPGTVMLDAQDTAEYIRPWGPEVPDTSEAK